MVGPKILPEQRDDLLESDFLNKLSQETQDNIKAYGSLQFTNTGRKARYVYFQSTMKAVAAAIEVVDKFWPIRTLHPKPRHRFVYSVVAVSNGINLFGEPHAIANVIVEAAYHTNGIILTNGEDTGYVKMISDAVFRQNASSQRRKHPQYGCSEIPCIGLPDHFPLQEPLPLMTTKRVDMEISEDYASGHNYFIFFNYDDQNFPENSFREQFEKKLEATGSMSFVHFFFNMVCENDGKPMTTSFVKQFNMENDPYSYKLQIESFHMAEGNDNEDGLNGYGGGYYFKYENNASGFNDARECKRAIQYEIFPNKACQIIRHEKIIKRILRLILYWNLREKDWKEPWEVIGNFTPNDICSNVRVIGKALLFVIVNNVDGCENFLLANIANILSLEKPNFVVQLYQKTYETHTLDLLRAIDDVDDPKTINPESIQKLLEYFCEGFPIMNIGKTKREINAYFQLFVYAIFSNKFPDLIEFCLKNSERPLAFSLIGAWLTNGLQEYFEDGHDVKMTRIYGDMKSHFVKAIKQMFEIAERDSFDATTRLLQTNVPIVSPMTYIEMVKKTNTPELFAQRNLERYVTHCWKQNMVEPYGFAPRTIFTVHVLSQLFILLLYAYVLLFSVAEDKLSLNEIVLWIIQVLPAINILTAYCEMCYKAEHKTLRWQDWFWLDMSIFTLTILIIFCRLVNILLNSNLVYTMAIIILCICFVVQTIKLSKYFAAFQSIGPKALILWHMTQQLGMFSVFFLLFLFMFSISSYRLANGRSDFAMSVIWPLFRRGLWEIFGELNEAIYLGNVTDCNGTIAASLSCQARSATLIVFVVAYLFATTILLVNLLIAACTCIFEQNNIQAENLWRYQKYKLLRSYEWATTLPWPFSMVENRIMGYFLRQHRTASTTGKVCQGSKVGKKFPGKIEFGSPHGKW